MADFDTISKTHARAHPMDFVNYCLDFDQDEVTFVQSHHARATYH